MQGASRGIGRALVNHYLTANPTVKVAATCRNPGAASELHALQQKYSDERLLISKVDVTDEQSIEASAKEVNDFTEGRLNLLLNVAGVLQDESRGIVAERRLSEITLKGMEEAFKVNTFGPMLVAKHFSPLLLKAAKEKDTAISGAAAIFFSARVGSIDDNKTGGWYTYRSNKAALNAMVKSLAIEMWSRKVIAASVHPGTVDTEFTRAFLKARQKYDVQDVDDAAKNLAELFDGLTMKDSGRFFDFKNEDIKW